MTNDIKEDIKVFVDNSFDKLNEMLSVWYSKLMEENSVVLAIARKAPRLLEWCKINFPEKENDKNGEKSKEIVCDMLTQNAKCSYRSLIIPPKRVTGYEVNRNLASL